MSDDYRKPAKPKAARSSTRGTVARRAEPPGEQADTGASPTNRERFADESAAAAAELAAARRNGAIVGRLVGAGLLSLLVLVLGLDGDAHLGPRGNLSAGLTLGLGAWMLAFGTGGAVRPAEAPDWWRWGAAAAIALGIGAFASGLVASIFE